MLTAINLDRADVWRGLPPIFQAVADAYSSRFDLSEPWLYEGYIYATDGKMAVRMRLEDVRDADRCDLLLTIRAADEKLRKPATSLPLLFDHTWSDDPTPIPILPALAVDDCPSCHGAGCDFCDYEGQFIPIGDRVNVAPGLDLGTNYIGLLREHGVTSIYRCVEPLVPQVFFAVGSVEGVLMPLAAEGEIAGCAVGAMKAMTNAGA